MITNTKMQELESILTRITNLLLCFYIYIYLLYIFSTKSVPHHFPEVRHGSHDWHSRAYCCLYSAARIADESNAACLMRIVQRHHQIHGPVASALGL